MPGDLVLGYSVCDCDLVISGVLIYLSELLVHSSDKWGS